MIFATRQQLAGLIVEGEGSLPGPQLVITTLGWIAVCLFDGSVNHWLASTREPGVSRKFATIDAAWRECQEIAKLAGYDGTMPVRVTA